MSAHDDEERVKDGIEEVCRHYLGDPEREEDGRLLFVCPACGGLTFALNPLARKAGCRTGRCPPGRHADALDLVSHFDGLPRYPGALWRGHEILGLPSFRDPDAAPDDRGTDEEGGWVIADDAGDPAAPAKPVPLEVPNRGPDEGALDEQAPGDSEDDREEGWYAALAEAEGRVVAPQGPPPRVYRPRGAVRLPSPAVVTKGEGVAALIAFPLGVVAARLLLGLAADSELAGTLDLAHRLAEHRALAELAVGFLASLLLWRYLSARRFVLRRHFGATKRERRAGPGVLRRALMAVEGHARSGIADFKRGARRGRERRRRRRRQRGRS